MEKPSATVLGSELKTCEAGKCAVAVIQREENQLAQGCMQTHKAFYIFPKNVLFLDLAMVL